MGWSRDRIEPGKAGAYADAEALSRQDLSRPTAMYDRHPSVELNARFKERPFQGVAPEEAGIVFVGLDAILFR